MISKPRVLARLTRWLGPWANDHHAPEVDVERRRVPGPHRDIEVDVFRPKGVAPRHAYVVAPGLHFEGPADPRLARFCSILAHCGFEVWAPYIPSYLAQVLDTEAVGDFSAVVEAAHRRWPKPYLFSISFGSLLALWCAGEHMPDRVGAVVVFGGYADLHETVKFCMTGTVNGEHLAHHDPLNLPVLFLNVLDELTEMPENRAQLVEAWREYMRRTWGKPEVRVDLEYVRIAKSISDGLDEAVRPMFEMGVGLDPRGLELLQVAIEKRDWTFLDPRPHMAKITCPVHIMHGADDDVIPYTQLKAIEEAVPSSAPCRSYLTGMYGHTRKEGNDGGLAGELTTMVQMLRGIADPATLSKRSSKGAA